MIIIVEVLRDAISEEQILDATGATQEEKDAAAEDEKKAEARWAARQKKGLRGTGRADEAFKGRQRHRKGAWSWIGENDWSFLMSTGTLCFRILDVPRHETTDLPMMEKWEEWVLCIYCGDRGSK